MIRIIYKILTYPMQCIGFIMYFFNLNNIKTDVDKCLKNIDESVYSSIPDSWLIFLIYAEDHRFNKHCGVDFYCILRAIYHTKIKKKYQGASTIQQQYVRVITNRYEKTLWRKIREQIIAIIITNKINKENIAKTYLKIAFYGSQQLGLNSFLKKQKISIAELDDTKVIELIARLKYPEPYHHKNKVNWENKIKRRKQYILGRIEKYSLISKG